MYGKKQVEMSLDNNESILNKVRAFLKIDLQELDADTIEGQVRELCARKLCWALGLRCKCNYHNEFFTMFSSIIGEAVSQILDLKLNIAPFELKFIRYNGLNFVTRARELLEKEDLDVAFIDIFNLIDDNKEFIKKLFKFS